MRIFIKSEIFKQLFFRRTTKSNVNYENFKCLNRNIDPIPTNANSHVYRIRHEPQHASDEIRQKAAHPPWTISDPICIHDLCRFATAEISRFLCSATVHLSGRFLQMRKNRGQGQPLQRPRGNRGQTRQKQSQNRRQRLRIKCQEQWWSGVVSILRSYIMTRWSRSDRFRLLLLKTKAVLQRSRKRKNANGRLWHTDQQGQLTLGVE